MQSSRLLTYLTRIVYGIIVPGCLLYLALVSHFDLVRERQTVAWQEKLSLSLDSLSKFHEDDRFFHGLLQRNFRYAAHSPDPSGALVQRIRLLRQKFPGMLRFVVWDKNGAVIPELSDEKRYQYVMKSMHQVIGSVYDHLLQVVTPMPETLPAVTSRMPLLRGYFGQFLMEKHMALPLLEGYLGSCLRASEDKTKGLLWYQLYPAFGLICFINYDAMNIDLGPKMLIDRFNAASKTIKLGYFDTQKLSVYGAERDSSYINDFMVEANAFFNSAVEFRRTADWLLLFRQVSPRLIVFSRLPISGNLDDSQHQVRLVMFGLLKWLLVVSFLLFCLKLRYQKLSFSVKQKMLLLFLFANGLPLMILGATGYEFFEQKKNSLIHEAHEQSSRIIKELDNLYPAGRERTGGRLSSLIRRINGEHGAKEWPKEQIRELQNLVDSLSPSESYLFNRSGEQLFAVGQESFTSSVKVIRDFFSGALAFFNNKEAVFVPTSKNMLEMISDEASVYYGVLNQLEKIGQQNYGSGMRWTYLDMLGDRKMHNSWAFLLVAWRPSELQRTFLQERLAEVNAKIAPRQIIVMEKGSEVLFPESYTRMANVRRIMHRTQSRKILTDDNLMIAGKAYIATCLTGIEMSDAIIMAVYPRDLTLQAIEKMFRRVIFAALFSIVVVLVIVRFFSGRMLAPVSGLAGGVRAITQRDFKFRVDHDSEDEFGQLIKVFNETIGGMQELAIGTAVQTSLLPAQNSRLAGCSLFARSIFMSKMGGDYYDYFSLDAQRMAIFFGDVAGHGIPAALVMAMAKGVITTARPDYTGPADLLGRVNSIFLHLKEKGWRRMMTGLCLELNCDTGEFKLANAGQCYPIIVDRERSQVKYVKAVGMPLGNTIKKAHVEVCGQLQPGDTLVLYTDGIVESTNAAGDVFDFSRFEKLLLASWHEDLETYWTGIFKGYSAWTSAQDDDITFLMVKYEPVR